MSDSLSQVDGVCLLPSPDSLSKVGRVASKQSGPSLQLLTNRHTTAADSGVDDFEEQLEGMQPDPSLYSLVSS